MNWERIGHALGKALLLVVPLERLGTAIAGAVRRGRKRRAERRAAGDKQDGKKS